MASFGRFRVSPRLAALLGENYRSTESALMELVANAWDADAGEVKISIPTELLVDSIVVEDDGLGMTEKQIREDYLSIADDRRLRRGAVTAWRKRQVKGHKGIGKFAGLAAAELLELRTWARGIEVNLEVSKPQILATTVGLDQIDLPLETNSCDTSRHGTKVTLSHLNQKFAFPDPDKLRRMVALEYGREAEFRVAVNGQTVQLEDLPGESFTQEITLPSIGLVRLRFTVVSEGQRVSRDPGIAIRVKGKVIGRADGFGLETLDDIPAKISNRVFGEVEADGLSEDVTADWGAVIENSKGLRELREWVGEHVRGNVVRIHSRELNLVKARLQQEINRRLLAMPEHRRRFAESQIQKVLARFYAEREDRIVAIVSVVLDALEKDEYWTVIQEIDNSKAGDVQALAEALTLFGLADIASIGQQARRRLSVLDEMDTLIANDETIESQVHSVIEKNLWMLGADYALISSNQSLTTIIHRVIPTRFPESGSRKRPDLLLGGGMRGDYLLIEFKRPSHAINRDDQNQAEKYRDALNEHISPIRLLVLGGRRDTNFPQRYDRTDVQITSYVDILSRARAELSWLIDQLEKA